jgi:hypothetical protein
MGRAGRRIRVEVPWCGWVGCMESVDVERTRVSLVPLVLSEDFNLKVMHAYVDALDFSALEFDTAIRTFLQVR